MAIIKKPIRKTLFYLASLAGVISILIIKLTLGNSSANLSQLETKVSNLIPLAKADLPYVHIPEGGGGGDGCGSSSGDDGGDGGDGGDGSSGSSSC